MTAGLGMYASSDQRVKQSSTKAQTMDNKEGFQQMRQNRMMTESSDLNNRVEESSPNEDNKYEEMDKILNRKLQRGEVLHEEEEY